MVEHTTSANKKKKLGLKIFSSKNTKVSVRSHEIRYFDNWIEFPGARSSRSSKTARVVRKEVKNYSTISSSVPTLFEQTRGHDEVGARDR